MVFGVGLITGGIYIHPRLTPVAMATAAAPTTLLLVIPGNQGWLW